MRILRQKYKEAVGEIKDLSNEHFQEKEYLLESVREMEKEMELYKAVCNKAFNHEEVDRIVAKSRYDPDQKQWTVPEFMFRSSNRMEFVRESTDRNRMYQERNQFSMHMASDKRAASEGRAPMWKGQKKKPKEMTLADFADSPNIASKYNSPLHKSEVQDF